ncbi:unnamed protein product [Malus baccata var. baccata]
MEKSRRGSRSRGSDDDGRVANVDKCVISLCQDGKTTGQGKLIEGNSVILLLIFSSKESDCPETSLFFNVDKKNEYYRKLREDLKKVDKDDKVLYRHRCREKRLKDKIKSKRGNTDEQEEDDVSDSEGEPSADRPRKRPKIYFDSESDGEIKKQG